MKAINVALAIVLLISPLSVPAHADFKYTSSTKMTGGSLYGVMKFAARFSKKGENPLDPVVTTYYIKGDRLRTDNSDGTIEIIDLEGRRIIRIDTKTKAYSVQTFDEIKAAMEQAMQQMQQGMQQAQQQAAQPAANPQNVQVSFQPKIEVTPGTSNRVIMGQQTNETVMQMDLQVQATGQPDQAALQSGGQATGQAPDAAAGPQTVSGTMAMTVDTYVAPSVPGYQEIGEFYKRLAQEINWTPPSNMHFDPRMSQGMEELQKNSSALRGLPMLEYITMGMKLTPEQQAQLEEAQKKQAAENSSQSSAKQTNTSSKDDIPTTPSAMVVKGLGSMFGKKKQQDNPPPQSGGSAQNGAADNTPASAKMGSLIEMTVEVTSYSDSSLDGSVFALPAGFNEIKVSPDQVLGTVKGPGPAKR
jgi:hypothetical protein